jgi:hypothetical protein
MTVGELRALLKGVPDDMQVYVPIESGVPGAFAFEQACPGISGVIEFGPPAAPFGQEVPEEQPDDKAFLVAPHSFNPDHHKDGHCSLN